MVEIVHWNPKISIFDNIKLLRKIPIRKRANNFGDLIGPMLVERILHNKGLENLEADKGRLLTVGSIFFMAKDGDTVWGSGFLNDNLESSYSFHQLDVRSVRGPLTRSLLKERFSIDSPDIYGDPALLVPLLFPEIVDSAKSKSKVDLTIVPHWSEYKEISNIDSVISPQSDIMSILERIARSRFVVSSSLHGIVLAEAFGVPARLFLNSDEQLFKYRDYYEGTGRFEYKIASSITEAIEMGGEKHPPIFDAEKLLSAFPYDLFMKKA